MKGHLRERSPGKWSIVIDVPDKLTGKKKRKWHSFHGTKREAQKEAARIITEIEQGRYVEQKKATVADFFDEWLAFVKPHVSAKTHERYSEICLKNWKPLIGDKALTKITTETIDGALSKALVSGRADGKGGLSPRSVHHMRRILSKAMKQAVTWKRIIANPVTDAQSPKVERKKMLAYDPAQTVQLLDALKETRLYIPVLLAVKAGMRRGEILALRWRNVELGDNLREISVVESAEQTKTGVRYKSPKNGKSRTVAMSASLVADLKAHKIRQAEEQLRVGVRPDNDSFVVAQYDGKPLQPRSLSHEWTRLVKKIEGLPYIRFHDLRHSHASQMLKAGVHPKVASERLGHSSIGITLDLYSHVMPGMQADAAEAVDAALQSAKSSAQKTK
jgi:integrase